MKVSIGPLRGQVLSNIGQRFSGLTIPAKLDVFLTSKVELEVVLRRWRLDGNISKLQRISDRFRTDLCLFKGSSVFSTPSQRLGTAPLIDESGFNSKAFCIERYIDVCLLAIQAA